MQGDELLKAIRARAQELWEQAGRPEGGDMAFWERAKIAIEREREERNSLASEG